MSLLPFWSALIWISSQYTFRITPFLWSTDQSFHDLASRPSEGISCYVSFISFVVRLLLIKTRSLGLSIGNWSTFLILFNPSLILESWRQSWFRSEKTENYGLHSKKYFSKWTVVKPRTWSPWSCKKQHRNKKSTSKKGTLLKPTSSRPKIVPEPRQTC